jgi:hypothetical protein
MIDGILCEICKNGDNEAELLLCDSCGRGYHTYCIRLAQNPSHESDPWYCTGCIQDQHESIQNTQKQAENDACVCRNPRRRR